MKLRMATLAVLVCSLGGGLAWAAGEHPEVPKSLDGVEIVASDKVMAAMESGSALLVDARKAADFEGGTIPGAVNCQVATGDPTVDDADVAATVAKLKGCAPLASADLAKPTITFCNGITCWRSPKMALALKKMGFKSVQWYRDGMNDWNGKGLPKQ